MGKRIELNPGWLVALLNQWAIHDLRRETGGLGYASGSSWMRGLKSSPSSSIDPTGYAARDFRDVEAAMTQLKDTQEHWWAAVTMFYKPWAVNSFRQAGYPFNDSRYYDRLHRGHAKIAELMDEIKANRATSLEKLGGNALRQLIA
jgi:hypothetical protein